jgi:hypothetical protein
MYTTLLDVIVLSPEAYLSTLTSRTGNDTPWPLAIVPVSISAKTAKQITTLIKEENILSFIKKLFAGVD